MKKLRHTLLALLCCLFINKLTAQSISYSYDNSGNMVQRSIQVFGFRLGNFAHDTIRPLNFKVYPNPANNYLTIEGALPENVSEAKLCLLNMNGQVLKNGTYNGLSQNVMVGDLAPGAYLLEIRYKKDQKSTYKIIITN